MVSSRLLGMVVALCIAMVAFVAGRSMSPKPATAADGKTEVTAEMRAVISQEIERQIAGTVREAVKKELEALAAESERDARINSAISTLMTIRSQLELYRIQHEDLYPASNQLKHWSILTQKTDAKGNINPEGMFGPYLQVQPANPFTGKRTVAEAGKATLEAGWSWDAKRSELRLVLPAPCDGINANDVEIAK